MPDKDSPDNKLTREILEQALKSNAGTRKSILIVNDNPPVEDAFSSQGPMSQFPNNLEKIRAFAIPSAATTFVLVPRAINMAEQIGGAGSYAEYTHIGLRSAIAGVDSIDNMAERMPKGYIWAGRTAKIAGLAGTAAQTGVGIYETYTAYQEGDSQKTIGAASSTLGALAGGAAGCKILAPVGAWAGGVLAGAPSLGLGAAPGAGLGSAVFCGIGAIGGAAYGAWQARKISDALVPQNNILQTYLDKRLQPALMALNKNATWVREIDFDHNGTISMLELKAELQAYDILDHRDLDKNQDGFINGRELSERMNEAIRSERVLDFAKSGLSDHLAYMGSSPNIEQGAIDKDSFMGRVLDKNDDNLISPIEYAEVISNNANGMKISYDWDNDGNVTRKDAVNLLTSIFQRKDETIERAQNAMVSLTQSQLYQRIKDSEIIRGVFGAEACDKMCEPKFYKECVLKLEEMYAAGSMNCPSEIAMLREYNRKSLITAASAQTLSGPVQPA